MKRQRSVCLWRKKLVFSPDYAVVTYCIIWVQSLLEWHPNIDSTDIIIFADNGHVTLEGAVKTCWEKMSAEDVVATLSGVIGITNVLAVVPSETIDDQIIANDIITALDRNAMIDAGDVDVRAENGIIALTGSVSSSATQRAAYTIAWYTRGVHDVRNNLVIEKKKEG